MCILFIRIPSQNNGLIIANNRDEFWRRSTARSLVMNDGLYCPSDVEKGGTWLAVNLLDFRYAVILNFHAWRYNVNVDTNSNPKSRGLLVKDFSVGKMSPLEFITELKVTYTSYRPFNLVIGDLTSSYLITHAHIQEPLEIFPLTPGEIYGISNGKYDDLNWKKVVVGKSIFTNIINTYHPSHEPSYVTSYSATTSTTITTTDDNKVNSKWSDLANKLLHEVLQLPAHCEDPTLLQLHLSSTIESQQLASIFVPPTVLHNQIYTYDNIHADINKTQDDNNINKCLVKEIDNVLKNNYSHYDTNINTNKSKIEKDISPYSVIQAGNAYINSILYTDTNDNNDNNDGMDKMTYINKMNIFGTRTSTVIITQPSNSSSSSSSSSNNNNITSNKSPTTTTTASSSTLSSLCDYYIIENDVDTETHIWSSHIFHS